MRPRVAGSPLALTLPLVVLALFAGLAPVRPAQIERWFSTGVYPWLQRAITPLANQVPFAILDILLAAALAGVLWTGADAIRRARREHSVKPLGLAGARLLAAAAAAYLVFLCVWGFNYRRIPIRERLVVADTPAGEEDVVRLGLRAVDELNREYAAAHEEGWNRREWQDPALRRAFEVVQRGLGDGRPAVPGRLKWTLLGPYFRWTSVDGMVNPFGLEVLANPDLLPFERPFVAAHEWGHLAGYADESEASFVGWLTCMRASAGARYSGWLFVYWQAAAELSGPQRGRLRDAMAAGPRRDVDAVAERVLRGQLPLLRRASWRIYDEYLKANRVEAGVRSYGLVLTLILRADFDASGMPRRRAS